MNQLLVDFEYLMKVMFRSHEGKEGSGSPQRWREAQGMLRKLEGTEGETHFGLVNVCGGLDSYGPRALPHGCSVLVPTEEREETGS